MAVWASCYERLSSDALDGVLDSMHEQPIEYIGIVHLRQVCQPL